MKKNEFSFSYEVYDSIDELNESDAFLLREAQTLSEDAYAPYSQFRVGAVALLKNGEIVRGTNQENASYPAGVCAEHGLLVAAGTIWPDVPIDSLAVSYRNKEEDSNEPITPCGICRQALIEFENRVKEPIRLILGGLNGKVFVIPESRYLLPLGFTGEAL